MFPEQISGMGNILHFGREGLTNIKHYESNFHLSLKLNQKGEYVWICLLPSNKWQDEMRWPQVASGKVRFSYYEKFFH